MGGIEEVEEEARIKSALGYGFGDDLGFIGFRGLGFREVYGLGRVGPQVQHAAKACLDRLLKVTFFCCRMPQYNAINH